ncbi:MAG: SDR family oxidoreductase [Candidatus Helarchaeota archaeon]|nr:SDR family oxidoreductase [Candidatus Helarchaeota archaeon]
MKKDKNLPFLGKTAVIVGGSQGIGKATAFELARLGANVCIIARNKDRLEAVQEELESQKPREEQQMSIISADATIEDQIRPALEKFIEESGCDILINCVGGAWPHYVQEYKLSDFEAAMTYNYTSAVIPIMTVLPHFMKQGGHIVNMSSMAGYMGIIGYTTYSPAKFAMVGLSEALRHELKPYKIHISVVYPSDTDTPGLKDEEKTKMEELKILASTVKLKQPEDVAKTIVKGIRKKKFNIHIGSSGWINWAKRHLPWLYVWFIDRDLKKSRKKLGKDTNY